MNKEIESLLKINETIITSEQCKEHRTLRNDERVLLMNNIKIKDYIKELEQKESILDKVTDKLKEDITTEDIKDDCSLFVRVFKGNLIERFKEVIADVLNQYRKEILNIIEGEKK